MLRYSNLPIKALFSKSVYNNNVTYECGEYLASFWLYTSYIKYRYPSIMDLKSYKCMQIRAIKKSDKFTKGSKYTLF